MNHLVKHDEPRYWMYHIWARGVAWIMRISKRSIFTSSLSSWSFILRRAQRMGAFMYSMKHIKYTCINGTMHCNTAHSPLAHRTGFQPNPTWRRKSSCPTRNSEPRQRDPHMQLSQDSTIPCPRLLHRLNQNEQSALPGRPRRCATACNLTNGWLRS